MNSDQPLNSQTDSQALLNQVILDYIRDKRRRRFWRGLYRIFLFLVIGFFIFKMSSMSEEDQAASNNKPHVGLIDLKGTIFEGQSASADNFEKGLASAYKNNNMKSLIIRINSPGGSPVQAEYMYNLVHYYQKKYPSIKIYSVCVDLCASAAYYVAAATDEIYASPSSMVGSIGVLYNGFGFVDTLEKLGATRRLQTAGVNKGFLDPFTPEKPEDAQKLQVMLDLIHQQFIARVKEGRKSRLHIDNETFSGLFWTGEQSLSRGLIDGFASTGQLARDKIKLTEMYDYTYKPNWLEQFSKNIGTAMADQLPVALGLNQGFK